ncbi:hypothetical protein Dimus_030479, partial [Dionaea muscipula]
CSPRREPAADAATAARCTPSIAIASGCPLLQLGAAARCARRRHSAATVFTQLSAALRAALRAVVPPLRASAVASTRARGCR